MIKFFILISISTIISILGSLGGQLNKFYRRICIPLIWLAMAIIYIKNWRVLSICSSMGVFALGYGIPDYSDDGSGLGKFMRKKHCRIFIIYVFFNCANSI